MANNALSRVVFSLTQKQVNALQLLKLDPGEVDPRWQASLAQLQARGLVTGDGARAWELTTAGRLAAELMAALPNGHA